MHSDDLTLNVVESEDGDQLFDVIKHSNNVSSLTFKFDDNGIGTWN